jgi:uncharacterized protein YdeI (YjbR/CyaY-like superfamily)
MSSILIQANPQERKSVPSVRVDPRAIHVFESQAAFERWLSEHHASASEIYLRIYKKGSGQATVSHAEALDVALCWGWIDAIRKSYDQASFLQRFTPRRPKSIWSQINREHVARLTAAGRMTPHGQRQVEAAQADGRWAAAYAGQAKASLPDDLLRAISANARAQRTFASLNATNRFALGFRLGRIKGEAARTKRIAAFVAMLARGETFHPNGAAAKKPAKKAAAKKARTKRAG